MSEAEKKELPTGWSLSTLDELGTVRLGKTPNKKVKISSEHIGFKWLTYDDALDLLTYDNAKEGLKDANEFLTQKTLADY